MYYKPVSIVDSDLMSKPINTIHNGMEPLRDVQDGAKENIYPVRVTKGGRIP